jgi:hypothetical protein
MRPATGLMALWIALAAAPVPAQAYSCALSPAKDAVIVKTDNPSARAVTCKVDCLFTTPEGPATISCSQQIPAGAKGWYVCLLPIGGRTFEFARGSESWQIDKWTGRQQKTPRERGFGVSRRAG